MDLLDVGRIVAGLALLVLGGELLVRGASALARRVGISSLVVGLTVVSAATSAPPWDRSAATSSTSASAPGGRCCARKSMRLVPLAVRAAKWIQPSR